MDCLAALTTAAGSVCARSRYSSQLQPGRQVAVEWIVGAGLVGDHVRAYAAANQFRKDLGGIAQQGDEMALPSAV